MARRKSRHHGGLGGEIRGTAAGEAAWERLRRALIVASNSVGRAMVALQAGDCPKAVAQWKAAADAMTGAKVARQQCRIGRVPMDNSFDDAIRAGSTTIERIEGKINDCISQMAQQASDARQVDPEWTEPRYSRSDFPAAPTDAWDDEPQWPERGGTLEGFRGRRRRRARCC